MADLSAFPITSRWPPSHPDRLQLYSLPTPNGVKVSIMLEETGLPYEAHLVDFGKDEQKTPEFLSLNPNGKIPAIIDPDGPGGKPLPLWESGAILGYLAGKTDKMIPLDPARMIETMQWVHFQASFVGPMFGQVGFFNKFAGKVYEDKRPLSRYVNESKRILGVMDAAACRPAMVHGRRLLDRRHFDARLGAQPDHVLRGARAGRIRHVRECRRRGWSAALRGPRCSGGCRFRSGLDPSRERGSIDAPRPFRRFSPPPRGITSVARLRR